VLLASLAFVDVIVNVQLAFDVTDCTELLLQRLYVTSTTTIIIIIINNNYYYYYCVVLLYYTVIHNYRTP